MVVIRLARGGDKKNPFYHIVVADQRNSRDGRFIERIGYYNPMARGLATPIKLDLDRVDHWRQQGAQLSERVQYLVKAVKKGDVLKARERVGAHKLAQAAAAAEQQKATQKAEAAKAKAEADATAETQAESAADQDPATDESSK